MEEMVRYPIGEQDFKSLREMGFLYVDKTQYIDKIVKGSGKYYFLARPRRFGKSLFLSALRYFFEGRRELFKGLYIDSTDWDWEPYPVLRLDLNTEKYADPGLLDGVLNRYFRDWEEKYDIDVKDTDHSQRFSAIIKAVHEKTGKPVVILVDEYDKPLVGNLNNAENFEHYRRKLASIYSNFKSSAEHIRLVFLTGVSRFSKLSVFSDLNNLWDITFTDEFADICGITEKELFDNFKIGIQKLADKRKISYDEACARLKRNYDGYRFSTEGSDIYNPWAVLNAMAESKISNYWSDTGDPSIIAESLKRVNADLEKFFDTYCTEEDLKGLDLLHPQPIALMYQTGYLTIKDYNERIQKYHLGIPNPEVKKSLYRAILPYYAECRSKLPGSVIADMVSYLILGKPEDFMKSLQTFFAGVSFKMKMDNENNFHNAFFLLMDLIGMDTTAEAHTSDGSIDLLIKTDQYIYIVELKYDGTAQAALDQINDKKYARPYQTDSRKIFKIGVNFSSKTRCIEDWIIEN